MTDPAAREREVTEILDDWDWVDGTCLVGGYAVSAYGKPRYSRDLDFVIPESNKELTKDRLVENGFSIRPLLRPDRPDAFHDSITLERGLVSIDLMIGHVQDKRTEVNVPGDWITSHFRETRLILITGSTRQPVRVCRPEALWVLKLVAGRNQDLADLFAISSETVNVEEIRTFLGKVENDALRSRFRDEARRLRSDRIFNESESARFSRTSSESARSAWIHFKRRFSEIVFPGEEPMD